MRSLRIIGVMGALLLVLAWFSSGHAAEVAVQVSSARSSKLVWTKCSAKVGSKWLFSPRSFAGGKIKKCEHDLESTIGPMVSFRRQVELADQGTGNTRMNDGYVTYDARTGKEASILKLFSKKELGDAASHSRALRDALEGAGGTWSSSDLRTRGWTLMNHFALVNAGGGKVRLKFTIPMGSMGEGELVEIVLLAGRGIPFDWLEVDFD